jgi:outer membrane protein assembly factor BamB
MQRPKLPQGTPIPVASPTGAIIPDGFGGVLLSVRWVHSEVLHNVPVRADQFVYRITQDGEIAFKFPLPKYAGPLHDGMVLGEQDLGFATRGGLLIAFDVKDGSEAWRWDSGASEIEIFVATAGGGCAVRTPRGVVQVEKDGTTKDLFLNEYLHQE